MKSILEPIKKVIPKNTLKYFNRIEMNSVKVHTVNV